MDNNEVALRIEYEIAEKIIDVLQSHKNSVDLATLKCLVSNAAPNISLFIISKFSEDGEWVVFLKKFPEIFAVRNGNVSFSKYFIKSNDSSKKCSAFPKSPRNSISVQGQRQNTKLEASAVNFFKEVLGKVEKMHYEKLFELLCTRSDANLSNYFLEYSLTEMYAFFTSRENVFTISQDNVSLNKLAISQNLKQESIDASIRHRLQCGVIYLLNYFYPLHYAEGIQCLRYVFDDVKCYLKQLSLLEHRKLFKNFPHLIMDERGFLTLKSSNVPVQFSTFATNEKKIILLFVALLAFNGETHFQKLIGMLQDIDPNFFRGVTVSQQFFYFKNNSDFFTIPGDGYVNLVPGFAFQSFAPTSDNYSASSTSGYNSTSTSCSSGTEALKQNATVAMNSKGIITKTIFSEKTKKQSFAPTLDNRPGSAASSYNSTTTSCSSGTEALKQNAPVAVNSKGITAKTIFSEKTKKQLSDLLKENALVNGDSPSDKKIVTEQSLSSTVSVKCHKNIEPASQSEEISVNSTKDCSGKENASESFNNEINSILSSVTKQSYVKEEIISNGLPRQSCATKLMNVRSMVYVYHNGHLHEKPQNSNSSHLTDVDAVIKNLTDNETSKSNDFSTNYFVTRVKQSVLYLFRYFELIDHVFVMKALLHVMDDIRDHFFLFDVNDQHDIINSCKTFISEELMSYTHNTYLNCLSYREQYLLFISYILLKHTRLHILKIFSLLEHNQTTFPVHLFTDAHKMKYFQCLKKYFFVDNEGYVELNIFPEVAALSAELHCLITPELLRKIRSHDGDLESQSGIQSEIQQLKSNEVFKHLPESVISNTVDICCIVLTFSQKMYYKSLYCCLTHYGVPETREYFKALSFTDGCNIFQNIPTLFDVKCNYVSFKENVLIPYISLREAHLSDIMQQIHFFHTGYKNKQLSFKLPYVSSNLASFIEHLSKKEYFSSFLANSLHNGDKIKANVTSPNKGAKTVNRNSTVNGPSQLTESSQNSEKNVPNLTDSRTEAGKDKPDAVLDGASCYPTCSEIESKMFSESKKAMHSETEQNIAKNVVFSPPPVPFSGKQSQMKEKVKALYSSAKWKSNEEANDRRTDRREHSSSPIKYTEIPKEKTLLSSQLPPNVSNAANVAISSNLVKHPVNEVINKASIGDDKNSAHSSVAFRGNASSSNDSSVLRSMKPLPNEVMSGRGSYEEYCSALVDSVLGKTSVIDETDNFSVAKHKECNIRRLNVFSEAFESALVTSVSSVAGLNVEIPCNLFKMSKYSDAVDGDNGPHYKPKNSIEERAINFFIVILGNYDVGVPSSFLVKHLSLASLEVKQYMKELYTSDILPFFWKHKKIFYVSPYSQLVYLISSWDESC